MWNKQLSIISQGKLEAAGNTSAILRAKRILEVRDFKPTSNSRYCGDSDPSKGIGGFFSFEEDLIHHINEAYVVISTGSTVSFFSNPYVRDWLGKLEPKHRPLYRVKFLRILRVIQFVLNSEIGLMLMECFLRYGDSIVASTSDFWGDSVRKASFGAYTCIRTFMAKQ